MSNKNWASVDVNSIPKIVTPLPGPKSVEYHSRAAKYMKGYSSQVSLFPVCFESGFGYTLKDVDGNEYIDFSSGIYVTGLGHCHPKISEAVAEQAKKRDHRRTLRRLPALRFRYYRSRGRTPLRTRRNRQVRVHILLP